MPPLREEAESLCLGLMMGLVQPVEVISWADRAIAEMANPPIEVIDIATSTRQPSDELARLLKRVPGPANLTAAAHRVLGILRARLVAHDLALDFVVNSLWIFSIEATIPEVERRAASNFSDEYECLDYYGTAESLRDEVVRFLAEHTSEPDGIA